MRVRMLKEGKGSNDGISVKAFLSETEYEVGPEISASVARQFVEEQKIAEYVEGDAPATGGDEKLADDDQKASEGDAPAAKTDQPDAATDPVAKAAEDAAKVKAEKLAKTTAKAK